MAIGSTIEWTEATWNPIAGCTVLSPGCANCYAMRMASRLEAMGQEKYRGTTRISGGRPKWTGRINLDEKALRVPASWKVGKLIFVNSMSDLFHEAVPQHFIARIFEVMRDAPQHTFQILTKRAERLEEVTCDVEWPDNVWIGVSIENQDHFWRIDHLRRVSAKVRFLSLEPLLGPIALDDLRDIHWVIAGGESGPASRPLEPSWISIHQRRLCRAERRFPLQTVGRKKQEKHGTSVGQQDLGSIPQPLIGSTAHVPTLG